MREVGSVFQVAEDGYAVKRCARRQLGEGVANQQGRRERRPAQRKELAPGNHSTGLHCVSSKLRSIAFSWSGRIHQDSTSTPT